jgi:hypothetical protein
MLASAKKPTRMLVRITTGFAVVDEDPGSNTFQMAHPDSSTIPTGKAVRI